MQEKNQPRKLTRKEKEQLSRQAAAIRKETGQHLPGNLKLTLALFVAACGFLLYIQTIGYDYALDDQAVIAENRFVHKGIGAIGTLFSTLYWDGFGSGGLQQYRPLSLVTFAIEWEFFPNNPAAGHFMNVFFYALTGFILFRLLYRLFKNNMVIPFVASLLFMAHPVHTEVVANIKSRDEILCMLLSVVSLYWLLDFVDGKKIIKLFLSALAFFLAILSKENALTIIAVAPLMLYFFREIPMKKVFTAAIPLVAAALLYLLIKASIQHGALAAKTSALTNNILTEAPDFLTRIATAFYVLGKYVLMLFFPAHLSMDYSYAEIRLMRITDVSVLMSIVAIVAMAVYALVKIKKKDAVAFGILYFFITISLVSNLVVVIGTIMGDRLLYMPSLGFTIVIAVLFARLFKVQADKASASLSDFFKTHSKVILISGALFILYGFKTVTRNPVWKNNIALMTSAVDDAPNSAYAHYLYANELVKTASAYQPTDSVKLNALYDKVLAEYLKAVEIYPTYAEFYSEAAATYRKKKNITEALKYYDLALKYDPHLPQAYNGKGVIYFNAKKYSEAKTFFLEALKYNPNDGTAMGNVGSCFLATGDNDNAISYLMRALDYTPNSPSVMTNLGIAYESKGDKVQANAWYAKADQISKGSR